jgi:hypothetical protein
MKDETQHRTLNIPCSVTTRRLVCGPGDVLSVIIYRPWCPIRPITTPRSYLVRVSGATCLAPAFRVDVGAFLFLCA